MNVRIVVDSTADVSDEIRAKLSVVPLTVHFGEQEYVDGITINHKEFYEKLIESDAPYEKILKQSQKLDKYIIIYMKDLNKIGVSS